LPGTTYAQRTTNAATRVDPFVSNAARNVLIDIAGQSDLLNSLTAEQLLVAAESYAADRRAAGFDRIVVTTVPSMTDAWGWDANMEEQRVAYNDLLLNSTAFDAVADIASIPELADPSDTTYFSDGLHPTPAGADLMAPVIAAAVSSA